MQESNGPDARHVFACDLSPVCRKWLREHVQPEVIFEDLTHRTFRAGCVRGQAEVQNLSETTANSEPSLTSIHAQSAGPVDLYVAGFPCTPFSEKGRREGWGDEASQTFFGVVRTISVLRPRAVILENVPGIIKTGCIREVLRALRVINGYTIRVRLLNTSDYFLPQQRRKLYIVMFRTDALHADPQTSHDNVDRILQACKSRSVKPFWDWLHAESDPIIVQTQETQLTSETRCECGVGKICPVHPCYCKKCRPGAKSKYCAWRREIAHFLLRPRNHVRTREYLQQWRQVRKDKHLKAAPTYFQLGAKLKLSTHSMAKTQRERNILIALSKLENLMNKQIVLDLSQSVSRVSLRRDGLVPTLTTDCSKICVPRASTFLTTRQCLRLQGFHPSMVNTRGYTDDELFRLAGNAMSVPVIAAVMWAVMQQVRL